MTRESWWIAAKIFLGLPVLFYALLSVLEPQKEIWRKPTKKVLMAFIIAWSAVLCFIALVFAWMLSGRPVLFVKLPVSAFNQDIGVGCEPVMVVQGRFKS